MSLCLVPETSCLRLHRTGMTGTIVILMTNTLVSLLTNTLVSLLTNTLVSLLTNTLVSLLTNTLCEQMLKACFLRGSPPAEGRELSLNPNRLECRRKTVKQWQGGLMTDLG